MQAARHEVCSRSSDAIASIAASLRAWNALHARTLAALFAAGAPQAVGRALLPGCTNVGRALLPVQERTGQELTGRSARPTGNADVRQQVVLMGILLICSTLFGCATLTIPAIDPSGNRIFAPVPTQLTLPQLHGPTGTSIVPNAAFPEPQAPAACLQGAPPPTAAPASSAASRSSDERGRCGQMLLTPTRIVAPVGGEVVLLAGICGEDGYLVTGEPIEWMLAPDSVGEIVEVGDDMKGKRRSSWSKSIKPAVEKLDVDFARGRTSAEAGRITRGSLKPTDDLIIRKGQTWVSLTSPTEGLSRVTVLAPDSDVWDRRRQTATIYWVDATWQFPAPQTLRVGEMAQLVTQVKKAEGFKAADGWIVKYRLVNDIGNQFQLSLAGGGGGGSGTGADARVNSDAKALASISNRSNKPGTAIISIDVVRPEKADDNMPELPIARGQTMVTWSAPLLQLQVTGNDTTMVGQSVEYRISLANAGDLAAENVRLTMNLKNQTLQADFDTRALPTEKSNLGAVWNIGIIPARQVFETFVRITPTSESDNRIDFNATASPTLSEAATMPLLAVKPQLDLTFAPVQGMERVEVGQQAVFDVVATNTGRTTINNISLSIDSDAGLQHAEAGSNQISQQIPYLPPGQPQKLGVRFIVRKAGELSARLVAQVGGLSIAERKAFVTGVEATPRQSNMTVLLRPQGGSTQLAPNAEVGVSGVIQNRGQTMLTNIQMLVEYEPSLAVTNASPGINSLAQNRQLTWSIPSLAAGNQVQVEMLFRSIAASPTPVIKMTARSAEGVNAQETLTFNSSPGPAGDSSILPNASPGSSVLPPPGNNAPNTPSPASSNAWSLLIQPIDSQVNSGQRAQYSVSFQNNQQQVDQNVTLAFLIPQGVQVIRVVFVDGTSIPSARSQDGSILQLEPFRSLRAGEGVNLILELQHDVTGTQILEASLTSAGDPQGVRQQARVNVQPNVR